jgi:hypothetical protein
MEFAATERPSLHQCLSMVPRLRSMHLLPEKSYADYALEIRTLHPLRAGARSCKDRRPLPTRNRLPELAMNLEGILVTR